MRKFQKIISLFVVFTTTALSASGCNTGIVADKTGIFSEDEITPLKNMTAQRAAHTATLLSSGKVLITGGFTGGESSLRSTELFDPEKNVFTLAENMSVARAGHSATLLSNGKVLIAGGYNGEYLNTAELYDPATGSFAPAGGMVTGRSGHIAVLLRSGKVLLAGGVGRGWSFLADAEMYDPATNTFTATGSMTTARESHTATLLKDGRILIAGGHKDRRQNITIYNSAEIYDPARGVFRASGNMTVRRHKHDAIALSDGKVLIVGGSDERDGRDRSAYRTLEIYHPDRETFTAVRGSMNSPRYKLQGTTVLLPNGKILIAGGADRAEVFDPVNNTFSAAEGSLGTMRLFATATLLKNGRVLITGGYNSEIAVSSNAWIYQV